VPPPQKIFDFLMSKWGIYVDSTLRRPTFIRYCCWEMKITILVQIKITRSVFFASSDQWSAHCSCMPPMMLVQAFISCCCLDYCNSLLYGTTTTYYAACSRGRLHTCSLALDVVIMSHLCCGSCIGCRFGIESPSRLQVWSTNH